jgi:hypothetical protein
MCPCSCQFLPVLVLLAMASVAKPPLPRAKTRRTLRWWAILVGALLLAVAAGLYLAMYLSDRQLREAIAEADRLDPGWRFEDLEAARAPVPDAENGAKLVWAAGNQMPRSFHVIPLDSDVAGLGNQLTILSLLHPSDATRKDLQEPLTEFAKAVETARGLEDRPRGRYSPAWSMYLVATSMPHVQVVRDLALLLALDALQHACDGEVDLAVRSCQASLNAGRSLGDEPSEMSQLSRAICPRQALRALEQALAQGEASTKVLEDLQRLLTEEAEEPLELRAARAERVMFHQCFEVIRGRRLNRYGRLAPGILSSAADDLEDQLRARDGQAAYLRYFNEVVEIAKLPTQQQPERFQKLQLPGQKLPRLLEGQMYARDWPRLAELFHRNTAQLRCAAAALAAERYRLAEGQWPENLDALVPRYLAAVPADPYTGQPLRLKFLPDGLVIYSVAVCQLSDGTNIRSQGGPPLGTNLGFRLWDVAQRGKPPMEK